MTDPAAIRAGTRAQVIRPVVDLLRRPDGARDRQVLFGQTVQVDGVRDGWAEVTADRDGYRGFVPLDSLGTAEEATHWVSVPATHVYEGADLKSRDLASLSFASRVRVTARDGAFCRTGSGYIPAAHLMPVGAAMEDPVAVAEMFVGTPYLWGGNSRFGIDCSGLVQAAFLACALPCPGDSGDQERAFAPDALPAGTRPQRGDLLFWKGHVALVCDPQTLLHANARHMAVQHESISEARERIEKQGEGEVTSHCRPRRARIR